MEKYIFLQGLLMPHSDRMATALMALPACSPPSVRLRCVSPLMRLRDAPAQVVDRFNEYYVSAYTTAAQTRFLLLHDNRSEDGIRSFFQDVHELYIKVMLNPFHTSTTRITSPVFNQRVRALAKKHLG
mmetsp:Transcript_32790/g.82598  ORF Transcript_32790/g.82598 Transcript_32790/m.82598 type:complete len:128 (-) Transcript_32790:38-421(-)